MIEKISNRGQNHDHHQKNFIISAVKFGILIWGSLWIDSFLEPESSGNLRNTSWSCYNHWWTVTMFLERKPELIIYYDCCVQKSSSGSVLQPKITLLLLTMASLQAPTLMVQRTQHKPLKINIHSSSFKPGLLTNSKFMSLVCCFRRLEGYFWSLFICK